MSLQKLVEEYEKRNPGMVTTTTVARGLVGHDAPKVWSEPKPPKVRKSKNNWLRIDIEVTIPPSVNQLYLNNRGKGKGRIKSPDYRAWIEDNTDAVKTAGRITARPFRVTLTLPASTNKGSDCANREKAATDLLVACGVIPGDSISKGLWESIQRYDPKMQGDMARITVEAM